MTLSFGLTIAGATLAAMVSWSALDLPRPALKSEVSNVEKFSKGTRIIVLLNQKKAVKREIADVKADLNKSPGNRNLLKSLADLEFELETINGQLKGLK